VHTGSCISNPLSASSPSVSCDVHEDLPLGWVGGNDAREAKRAKAELRGRSVLATHSLHSGEQLRAPDLRRLARVERAS
jgi:hypothetical protein